MHYVNDVTTLGKSAIHGFGCFAKRRLAKGTMLYSNVIPYLTNDVLNKTQLMRHSYPFGRKLTQFCICTSNMSYVNSAEGTERKQNVRKHSESVKHLLICIEVIETVKKGEELFLNYKY